MPPPENANGKDPPAGRVRHDSTGRAIWEWAADSGRHALDSTSRLLKRLDLPGLTLADDEKKKQEDETAAAGRPAPPTFGGARESDPLVGGKRSFNPYDNRTPVKKVAPRPAPTNTTKAAQPPRKPGFFGKLFGGK